MLTLPLSDSFTQQGIERYEFNKLTRFQSLIPMLHLTFQIAKRLTKTKIEPGYRACLKHCMQRTLWKLQVSFFIFLKFLNIFQVGSGTISITRAARSLPATRVRARAAQLL